MYSSFNTISASFLALSCITLHYSIDKPDVSNIISAICHTLNNLNNLPHRIFFSKKKCLKQMLNNATCINAYKNSHRFLWIQEFLSARKLTSCSPSIRARKHASLPSRVSSEPSTKLHSKRVPVLLFYSSELRRAKGVFLPTHSIMTLLLRNLINFMTIDLYILVCMRQEDHRLWIQMQNIFGSTLAV